MRLLVKIVPISTLLLGSVSLTGCVVPTLSMNGKLPVSDQSVPTPQKVQYTSVMVLPPKGSERGQVSELADLEKALLKKGIRVISSGVTGRVILDNAEGKKNEGAKDLTDLERALVLARKSNADALLQVIKVGWEQNAKNYRYYRVTGKTFEEVKTKQEYEGLGFDRRWRVTGPSFEFEAKIIDVESGEIVTAVDLSQSTVREIATRQVELHNPARETVIDTPDLREDAINDLMDVLSSIIAKGKAREVAPKGPSPEQLALEAERKKLDEDRQRVDAERKRLDDEAKKRAADDEARKAEEAKKAEDAKKGGAKKK